MVEMQMGPMIDIVFLLLVFFMVTARPIQPESDVGLQLPGTVEQSEVVNLPNEIKIQVRADGQVIVNELLVDATASQDMPELVRMLTRFKEAADANQQNPLVTVLAENGGRHQRVVDVLNACATANIRGVTFAPDDPEF